MKKLIALSLFALAAFSWSCDSSDDDYAPRYNGRFSKLFVYQLQGFEESRDDILEKHGVSMRDFIIWSTSDINDFNSVDQSQIKTVRDEVKKPSGTTLLQKVIPLSDVAIYMDNLYNGTIGGFVTTAADVKYLSTMSQIYNGLRLDYDGSKFFENGAGYAVIRYYSKSTNKLTIPYAAVLGGDPNPSWEWPWGGAGFTTSNLSDGGYPEYFTAGYSTPNEGAELYEVTPEGREMLRSVFTDGEWETFENPDLMGPISDYNGSVIPNKKNNVRNGMYSVAGKMAYIQTKAIYKGCEFTVRGEVNGELHLTTTTKYNMPELYLVEKGIWGVIANPTEVSELREDTI